jgi:hypothetical protein
MDKANRRPETTFPWFAYERVKPIKINQKGAFEAHAYTHGTSNICGKMIYRHIMSCHDETMNQIIFILFCFCHGVNI